MAQVTVDTRPPPSANVQPVVTVGSQGVPPPPPAGVAESSAQVEAAAPTPATAAATVVMPAVAVRYHESRSSALGGRKTLRYIIANGMFEKLSTMGLQSTMTLYLKREYHLRNTTTAAILFTWNSLTNFIPILGALASDSYGHFPVISVGSILTLLGLVVLWVTELAPDAQPVCPMYGESCQKASGGQLLLLLTAFLLTAIGAGGIRACSPTFGEDQIRDSSDPDDRRKVEVFYSWYYTSVRIAMIISIIVISKSQAYYGWGITLGLPVIMMFVAVVVFLSGYTRYIKLPPKNSSILRSSGRVVAAAWRKRRHSLLSAEARWFHESGSTFVRPTARLRFLNKACLITTPEEELSLASELPYHFQSRVCTVRQVEELKALIKVIPIWSTGIIISIANNPGPVAALQARVMDRRFLGRHIRITIQPGAYGLFNVAAGTLWLAFYAHFLVPRVAKLTSGRVPNGIPPKYRMGIGMAISCLANVVAGAVEHHRRQEKTTLVQVALGTTTTVSAALLIPQFCLMGLADAFNTMGQIDFYNSQFPLGSMKAIGNALVWLGQCAAGVVAALILVAAKRWMAPDQEAGGAEFDPFYDELNIGHYDYYYWVIAGLSLLNLFYYLLCCRAYGDDDCLPWEEAAADQGPVAPAGQAGD